MRIPKRQEVLTTGRIEPNKGQLEVAMACRNLGLTYYCCGEIMDTAYADKVEQYGAILLGKCTMREVKQMCAKAKVFALVSKAEIFPLSVLEAMSQGCQIVLTDTSEWKPDVHYAEYGNAQSIENAIKNALEGKQDYTKFTKQMTWDMVAQEISKIYEGIRQQNSGTLQSEVMSVSQASRT